MDLSKMSTEEARAIVLQAQNVFDASIADQQRSSPKEIQSYPIDLSIERTRANAIKVSFPFKSLLVEQASDINTFVYVVPISNESGNDPLRMGLRDVYKSEFGFRECYIYWDAQPTKSVLLKFFVRSNIENGRLVLDQNSIGSSYNIGSANGQNDGFTVLLSSQLIVPASGAALQIRADYINNSGFSNGSYQLDSIGLFPLGSCFKVPKGYTGEVIGMEINCSVAITASAWQFDLIAVPDGSRYTVPTDILFNAPKICSSTFSSTPASATPYKVNKINVGTLARQKCLIYENEIIVPACQLNGGTGGGGGIMMFMVRLTKNVG